MLCDGRELAVGQYPEPRRPRLHLGRGRDAGTFLIPDLRGRFLRGVNYAASGDYRDPDRDSRGFGSGRQFRERGRPPSGGRRRRHHQHPISGIADAIGQGYGAEWVRFHANKVPDDTAPVLSRTRVPSNPPARPKHVPEMFT